VWANHRSHSGFFAKKTFFSNFSLRKIAMLVTDPIQVQRFANALYGVQVGTRTMDQVNREIANVDGDINKVFNKYFGLSFGTLTVAQVAAVMVQNLGIPVAGTTVATAFITGQLNGVSAAERGAKIAQILNLYGGLTADPIFGPAATAWNAQIDTASNYSGSGDIAVGVGATYRATTGADNLVGTAFDDIFNADFSAGGQTLQAGDTFVGGAGKDTLRAFVDTTDAVGLIATGVETVRVQAQFGQQASNPTSNNTGSGNNLTGQAVQVDAQRTAGVTNWENNNSRSDLVIEDVRILDNQITKDITITMRETDPGNVDYGVYFDQNSLRNATASTSQIRLEVMDTRAVVAGKDPLLNSPYGGFVFTATNNATGLSQVVTLQSQAINDAQTYAQLAVAFQAAADAALGAGAVAVSVGSDFTVVDTKSATPVTGKQINILAAGSFALTTPAGSGWLATGVVPADSGLHTNFISGSTSNTDLVTSKIILDDVGRGSTGGDLVVGGLSVGDTSTSKGVERFEIEVQDNSKLRSITSTNNTLREVVLVNGVTTRLNDAFTTTTKDAGNLFVYGRNASVSTVPNTAIDDDALPGAGVQNTNGFGFSDVRLIDGSAMKGSIEFTSEITAASVAKYLNLRDTAVAYKAENVQFSYLGGAGADRLSTTIDSKAATAILTSSAREDFKFTMDGGAGNDVLTVTVPDAAASVGWAIDQKMFRNFEENPAGPGGTGKWVSNLTILGGEGNDTINKPTAGDFLLNGGAGNDVILTDNTGAGAKSVWRVSATDALGTTGIPVNNFPVFLYKGKLTVSFSASAGVTGAGLADADAPVDVIGGDANLTNGWEATVDIGTMEGRNAAWAVDQFTINQAIKRAIVTDPVLNRLLNIADGPGNVLSITSRLDGANVIGDLDFKISAATTTSAGGDFNVLSSSEATAAQNAYVEFTRTNAVAGNPATWDLANGASVTELDTRLAGQLFFAAGANSTTDTDNTIEGGTGNDVIALSSSAAADEVLLYNGYENGKDSVVNFTAVVGPSGDSIDFRSYLTGKVNVQAPNTAANIENRISTTLNADASVELNSVTIITPGGFNKNLTGDAGTVANTLSDTFAGLNATNLLAAINNTNTGSANYGGITAATLDAAGITATATAHIPGFGAPATANATTPVAGTVIGTVGKGVVMIENDDNLGEYAIFELTWTNGTSTTQIDFTAAQLIGVVDFGASIVGSVDNYVTRNIIDGLFL
jgi:hypothetical protein